MQHRSTLKFPVQERWSRPASESRTWLPTPSETVIDLLESILTDKEVRLSSRQYRYDARIGRRLSAASKHESPLARYVYANGAEEIKSHPFFKGISWSQLHLCAPPFVPRVRENQSITKYFEDEKDILTDESSSFASEKAEEQQLADAPPPQPEALPGNDKGKNHSNPVSRWNASRALEKEKRELGLPTIADIALQRIKDHFGAEYGIWRIERIAQVQEYHRTGEPLRNQDFVEAIARGKVRLAGDVGAAGGAGVAEGRRKKEKKRPRDKMLRDPVVGRKCMELRKRNAFFGYTYRRPRGMGLEEWEGVFRRTTATAAGGGEGGVGKWTRRSGVEAGSVHGECEA